MQTVDLAIIIPTLNEEKYIGKLLDSIAFQTVQPKEVVIVDAYSVDQTIKVVKKYQKKLSQLQYFQIPKYTISRQRNYGAKNTTAKHLLFLDADMLLLDPFTLEKYIREVEIRQLDIAAATNLPDSDFWQDRGLFMAMDLTLKTIKPIWPVAQGMNLYIKRKFWQKNNGFNEELKVGEDHEFVTRVVKNEAQFGYLKTTHVYTSIRRIKEMGRMRFAMKMTLSFVLEHSFLGYKNNPISLQYELGKHTA